MRRHDAAALLRAGIMWLFRLRHVGMSVILLVVCAKTIIPDPCKLPVAWSLGAGAGSVTPSVPA